MKIIIPIKLKFASSDVQSLESQEGSLVFFWITQLLMASLLGISAGLSLCLKILQKNYEYFCTPYVLHNQFVGMVSELLDGPVEAGLGHGHHQPVLATGGPSHSGWEIYFS